MGKKIFIYKYFVFLISAVINVRLQQSQNLYIIKSFSFMFALFLKIMVPLIQPVIAFSLTYMSLCIHVHAQTCSYSIFLLKLHNFMSWLIFHVLFFCLATILLIRVTYVSCLVPSVLNEFLMLLTFQLNWL